MTINSPKILCFLHNVVFPIKSISQRQAGHITKLEFYVAKSQQESLFAILARSKLFTQTWKNDNRSSDPEIFRYDRHYGNVFFIFIPFQLDVVWPLTGLKDICFATSKFIAHRTAALVNN